MLIKDFFLEILCVIIRYLPIRHKTGLFPIGIPDKSAPVFVSGNYFHTVKRLFRALKGQDCYLLVVDSAGINVWCASGVCDFNEHKIADAVNTYKLKDIVDHNRLILPQLSAVGIDKDRLFFECGFKSVWGPAHLDDINEFIQNNLKVSPKMKMVRFSFIDKVYMALGMMFAYFASVGKYYIIYAIIFGTKYNHYAIFILISLVVTISLTILIDYMPFKWPTTNQLVLSLFSFGGILGWVLWIEPQLMAMLPFYLFANAVITFLVCLDMLGSTVGYKTSILHWLKTFNARALFQPTINTNCVLCAKCREVCPKGLFAISNKTLIVDYSRECCECLACLKQCKHLAIENINKGQYKNDIKSISDEIIDFGVK